MKRNLVKILAMSSLLLTLGACGNKKTPDPDPVDPVDPTPTDQPVELTLGQLSNLVDGKWEYEGKNVIVRDLACYGAYDGGKGLTLGAPYSASGSDRSGGVEVVLKEAYNFQHKTKGLGAKVSVQGKVVDVNGHVTLQEAEVLAMSERDYTSGSRDPNTGADMTVWSFNDPQRDGFNSVGRTDSGKNFSFSNFSLLSIPESYDGTKEVEFYVNWPGENPFVEDEYNLDAIRVSVPAGQPTEFNKPFNDFFAAQEVGDQIDIYANLFYNDGIELRVATQWFYWDDTFVPSAEPIEVETEYAPLAADFDDKYTCGMPQLDEDGLVYRYDVTDLWSAKIDDISGADLSFVSDALKEDGGLVVFDMMTTYAHAPEMLDTIGGQLATAGYTPISQTAAEAIYRLESTEVEADVALRVVQDEEFHYALEMLFVGRRSVTNVDCATFGEAVTAYEEQLGDDTFASKLRSIELPSAPAYTGVNLSWLRSDYFGFGNTFEFTPSFAEGAFADDAAYEAYVEAFFQDLEQSGFAPDYAIPSLQITGGIYFCEETLEFATYEYKTDVDDNIIGVVFQIVKIDADEASYYLFDVSENSTWTYSEAAAYFSQAWATFTGKAPSITDYPDQKAAAFAEGYYYAQYISEFVSFVSGYCVPVCAEANPNNPTSTTWTDSQGVEHPRAIYQWSLPTEAEDTFVIISFIAETNYYEGQAVLFRGQFLEYTYTPTIR